MASVLQIKRGTTAAVNAYTPAEGELVLNLTTKELKVGDGTVVGGVPIVITSKPAVAATADKLTTARTIALAGDVTGSVSFDGSANVSITSTIAGKGAVNGIATLDAAGKIPSAQLPSYVDDVLEFTNNAAFPATGETGKIYVNTTDNTTWRWSGTVYVQISSGAVTSVNTKTGVVTLTQADISGAAKSGPNSDITSLTGLTTALSIAQGGTGATTATAALTALGAVPTTRTVAGKALSANITLVAADVGLGNVNNTADSVKSVATAAALTTGRSITLTNAVTGTVTFDGSANVSMTTSLSNIDLGVL